MIYNKLRKDIQKYIRDLCKWKGVEIIEGHLMPDHVHLLLEIPPRMSVSSFMGYLKGKSSLMIFENHSNLKYKFGNRNFWATGYYVSTVGLNEATIKKYIQEQENEDKISDSLTKKEFVNPFKSSQCTGLEQIQASIHMRAGRKKSLIGSEKTTYLMRSFYYKKKTRKN